MTLMMIVGGYGCAVDAERPPPAQDGEVEVAPAPVASVTILRTGSCDVEGEAIECKVETGRIGSIVNCFRGTQTCTGGTWSACGQGADAGTPP